MSDIVVSVIVPHFNDLAGLDCCLEALSTQSYPRGAYEIIVADNNSPQGEDCVRKVVSGRAQVVFVSDKGAGPARNGAVKVASGSILAFTDSDCIPDVNWLEKGIGKLKSGEVVGGRVELSLQGENLSSAQAFEKVFAFNNEKYITQDKFTITANLFCMRSDFFRVGCFKVGVSEDKEWCHRASEAGLDIVYEPEALVYHPAREDWQELKLKWERINRETYRLYSERRFANILWLIRSFIVLLSIFPHSFQVLFSSKGLTLRSKILALSMLFKQRVWRFFDYWVIYFKLGV